MLVLPGRLTHAEAPDAVRLLGEVLRREVDQAGRPSAGAVPIDAAALVHFDSSALAVLLECRRLAAAVGRRIELRHAPHKLEQLARLYGLDDVLGIG